MAVHVPLRVQHAQKHITCNSQLNYLHTELRIPVTCMPIGGANVAGRTEGVDVLQAVGDGQPAAPHVRTLPLPSQHKPRNESPYTSSHQLCTSTTYIQRNSTTHAHVHVPTWTVARRVCLRHYVHKHAPCLAGKPSCKRQPDCTQTHKHTLPLEPNINSHNRACCLLDCCTAVQSELQTAQLHEPAAAAPACTA